MTRDRELVKDCMPSRRQNALDINRRIFPDHKITRMSQYEIRRFADHIYLSPTPNATVIEYSFSEEYYKPTKRPRDHDMAGDFLLLMDGLHHLLDGEKQYRYPYGICDPSNITLLQQVVGLLLEFVNRYGLFGLYKEMSVQNEMQVLDTDERQYLNKESQVPLIGTKRFKEFLLSLNLQDFDLSDDFASNLHCGLISKLDYIKLFIPWNDSNTVYIDEEFLENYSENVAIILNSDVFVSAYYNTVLKDISNIGNHERFLEYHGIDDEPISSNISRFDELRSEDLVIGHFIMNDMDPNDDNFEQLLPEIAERLKTYLNFERVPEETEDPQRPYYDFIGYDFSKFFAKLRYKNIHSEEFINLCEMINPIVDGSKYSLPNSYQVHHYIEFNSRNSKWEFLTEAMSLIGMILNRRTLDLVYNDIETRICAKPGCRKSFTKHCFSTKQYHSHQCQSAAAARRSRANQKGISTPSQEEAPIE